MKLLDTIARQREEIKEIYSQKLVDREIKVDVEKKIIKVVSGVRRSGKSTLCLLSLKNKSFGYVNFDEKSLAETEDPEEILKAIKQIHGDVKILFLDEVQNLKYWELWVNSLYRRGYNLIVTGSNAKLLSKELSTYLTGRYISFELFPFSFREVLKFIELDLNNIELLKEKQGEIQNILVEYMKKGGFPEIWVKNLGKKYLETLFDSIVYKDIVKRWNVKYSVKIEDLGRYLFSIFSSKYSISKLKNILEFRSKTTVENYLNYLEEAYLIFSLHRFSFKEKEIIKSPRKVYGIDTGLINAVASVFSENIGKFMENTVFLELARRYKVNRELFYFQSKEGYEVDFLIKQGLNINQLIQVTYANSFDEIDHREIRALLKAKELFKKYKPRLTIITWDYEDEREISWFGKKGLIEFIPMWKWLLKLHKR